MPRRLLDDEDRPKSERERDSSERERPSWRDRDRKKDRSAHTAPDQKDQQAPTSPHNRFLIERERKGNLAAANALFSDSPREALEKKVLAASREGLDAVVDQYVQTYGYPSSFEVLSKFVEHSSVEVVKAALAQLEPLMAAQTPANRQKLIQALKLVSMMARDADARRAATGFIRRINAANV